MSIDMKYFEEMEAKIPHGKVRTRFAPSPTGYMHVGNLRTALYTYLIARHAGGTFILRIEDTDQGRLVEGATDVIYRTMAECGLSHDEGPDVGGPVAPYIQSERRDTYGRYAELLVERGHAYYCFCEKAESEEDSGEFDRADDPCRDLPLEEAKARVAAGEPYVIRQRIPKDGTTTFHDASFGDITVENKTLDDQVLLKRDGLPTYNFANVIDDHLMGITHVVRGSEYLSSAPKYNLLYEGFGWEVPTYVHCSPVMRDAQHKMSKRNGDPSYEDLKAQGYLTPAILNYVALLGWSPRGEQSEQEFFTLDELVGAFDIGGISKSPAIFDIEKLTYFNANYLRNLTPEKFCKVAEPYIRESVKNEAYSASEIAALLQARCEKLTDIPEKVDFFDALPDYSVEYYTNKKSKTNAEVSLDMLNKVLPKLEELPEWTNEALHDMLVSFAEELGVSKDKVRRYIRLTHLVPGILDLVDEGRMRMLPAVEVSYLSRREQETLLDAMRENACTPSHSQALKMKRFSQEGELGEALIRSIMEEEKPNQVESFRIPKRSIARFFRPSASREEVEARVVRALELLEQAERKRAARGKGGDPWAM